MRHLSQAVNDNSATGFEPLPDHDQHWVKAIEKHEILFKFIYTAAGNIKTLQSGSTPSFPIIAPEVWDQFKLVQIVSSVTGKLNNTNHHIQTIVGSHDIPTALFGLGEHIFNMKVLFHNPTIQNFVGKNAWRELSQEERQEKLGEMMAVYEYMNHNAAILQQTYANVSLELAAFESHTQAQGLVAWFRLFVDDMFMSMDQRTCKFVTTKITEMIDDLGEINTWERVMNKTRLEAVRAEACNVMSSHWLYSPPGSWKPSRLMSLIQKQ
ncbi:hypothetical protein BCON_0390g00010 [Botryotinia convoluta]|uniref:Uncharacterized protein n=1 Tax=Botryotinia convoluta TaxID=54673 RepID=A0A4Z1H8F1_9HELO|nr:hypothetical protein BCON_0390g00010 [Botryotinia convoluta]